MHCMAEKKSRKCSGFVLYSYLEQLKGKKSSKGVPFRRVGGVVRGVRTNPLKVCFSIHSDTYRLSAPDVLQNSTCVARYLGAKA